MQNFYNVESSEDGLTNTFTTRFNIEYLLVLTTVEIGDVSTFSLSLYPTKPHEIIPLDPWVRNTVVNLIGQFLLKDSNTIFYVCDIEDEREDKRYKVFDHWYQRSISDFPYIGKFDHSITSINGYKVNSAILYNKDNILIGHIIEEFRALMDIM